MGSSNPSPLRYPGGKYKISKLISLLIDKTGHPITTYVEPFAGGAGVALDMLFSGKVERVVINDSDRAIYSIWRALTTENDAFLDKVLSTNVTLEEWHRQRRIYLTGKKYSLEFAYSAFFLNRTNHSGILLSGPIGGQTQGDWKLDVRYNRDKLAKQIAKIGEHAKAIKVYNRDVFAFVGGQLRNLGNDAFVYFDPPYYKKGRKLYKNYFTPELHRELFDVIKDNVHQDWIVSYDDVPEIRAIYGAFLSRSFSLDYSLANNGKGHEIMYFKSASLVPSSDELARIGMGIMFGGE